MPLCLSGCTVNVYLDLDVALSTFYWLAAIFCMQFSICIHLYVVFQKVLVGSSKKVKVTDLANSTTEHKLRHLANQVGLLEVRMMSWFAIRSEQGVNFCCRCLW